MWRNPPTRHHSQCLPCTWPRLQPHIHRLTGRSGIPLTTKETECALSETSAATSSSLPERRGRVERTPPPSLPTPPAAPTAPTALHVTVGTQTDSQHQAPSAGGTEREKVKTNHHHGDQPGHRPARSDAPTEMIKWHERLCHLHPTTTFNMFKHGAVTGVDCQAVVRAISSSGPLLPAHCSSCLVGKSKRKPFTGHAERATQPLQKLHMDICGPVRVTGRNRESYFLTITDDYTRYVYVAPPFPEMERPSDRSFKTGSHGRRTNTAQRAIESKSFAATAVESSSTRQQQLG